MITISILGYGRVAYHLVNAFINAKGIELTQVYARNLNSIQHLKNHTNITNNTQELKPVDVFIIAVSDDNIGLVSSKIQHKNSLIVHTSGATSIEILKNKKRNGVFYPLQSFSKQKEINFSKVPFCIEAKNNEDIKLLNQIAISIGSKPYKIDSKQREYLHVSAVFVNNFVNHLYKIGHGICQENNIPFEILFPLLEESVEKIKIITPKEAQTGPAKRNDKKTIQKHLTLLGESEKIIYKLLTQSIQNEHT